MKIIKRGNPPPTQSPPWYMEPLTCPRCAAEFQLDSSDVAVGFGVHPEFMSRHFVVRTEKCPNGKSEITGPCPFCHERLTITRKAIPQPKTAYIGNDHMTKPV